MPHLRLLELFSSPAAHVLALSLAHFLWQGLAIGAVVALILHAINRSRPRARYAVGIAGLLLMGACPLLTFAWVNMLTTSPVTSIADARTGTRSGPGYFPVNDVLGAAEPLLLFAWMVGVLLLATRLSIGAVGIERLRRGRLPLPTKIALLAAPVGKRLKLNAAALVFVSRNVGEAMAVGFLKPLVLLPAAWVTEMPADVLEAVIAHELAHLARHDLAVNWLQRVIETLLFYHPAVWCLSQRVRVERELCADELAVAATGKRVEYVQALQYIAAQRQADPRPLLAAFSKGETKMRLLERVRSVLGQASSDSLRLWPAGMIAAALPLGLWAVLTIGPNAIAEDGDDNANKVTRDATPRKPVRKIVELEHKLLDQDGNLLEHKIEGAKPKKVELQFTKEDGSGDDRRLTELTVLVKRLSAQVERLQVEVAELRGSAGDKRAKIRDEDIDLKRAVEEEQRAEQARDRALKEMKLAVERAVTEEERAKELTARKQDLVNEQAAEAKELAAEANERAAAIKVRVRQLQERAEQRARVENLKPGFGMSPYQSQVRAEQEAIRNKIKGAREKVDAEIRELERKLEKLKEGKETAVREDIDVEGEMEPKLKRLLRDGPSLIK